MTKKRSNKIGLGFRYFKEEDARFTIESIFKRDLKTKVIRDKNIKATIAAFMIVFCSLVLIVGNFLLKE